MLHTRENCIPFSKSIKSQRVKYRRCLGSHCIPFSKSIKSQHRRRRHRRERTVSHSQRASNHNTGGFLAKTVRTVSHSQRASNHNVAGCFTSATATVSHSQRASNHNLPLLTAWRGRLYPILKEHQITTVSGATPLGELLYPILKEHQITTL